MVKEHESNPQHIQRKFGPTYLALKNKTTVYILTGMLVLFGIMSYNQMPRELMPEVVVPYIFVQTVYPGNSPVDIENLITRPSNRN
jgi:multidrug efflux pump subunit AcrB